MNILTAVLLIAFVVAVLKQRQDRLLYYEYGAWVAELRMCAIRPASEREREHCLAKREELRKKGWLIGLEGR